jgi:hypothetical protein
MYEEQYLELEVRSVPPPIIEHSENSYRRLPSFVSEPLEGEVNFNYGGIVNDLIPDEPALP